MLTAIGDPTIGTDAIATTTLIAPAPVPTCGFGRKVEFDLTGGTPSNYRCEWDFRKAIFDVFSAPFVALDSLTGHKTDELGVAIIGAGVLAVMGVYWLATRK